MEKKENKKETEKLKSNTDNQKKSKFALYWESQREPFFEIIDMKAVLR